MGSKDVGGGWEGRLRRWRERMKSKKKRRRYGQWWTEIMERAEGGRAGRRKEWRRKRKIEEIESQGGDTEGVGRRRRRGREEISRMEGRGK